MKKLGKRWLHSCHVKRDNYVLQGNECPYCGRTRTPQAEQKYAAFARKNNVTI